MQRRFWSPLRCGAVLVLCLGVIAHVAAEGVAVKTPAPHALTGRWRIVYHPNQAVRVYDVQPDGCVRFAEFPACAGRLELLDAEEGQWRLRFEGDPVERTERLTLCADQRLLVEHFNPASQWEAGQSPDQVGLGKRIPSSADYSRTRPLGAP